MGHMKQNSYYEPTEGSLLDEFVQKNDVQANMKRARDMFNSTQEKVYAAAKRREQGILEEMNRLHAKALEESAEAKRTKGEQNSNSYRRMGAKDKEIYERMQKLPKQKERSAEESQKAMEEAAGVKKDHGFKEQMITCAHPQCDRKTEAWGDGYCSRVHASNHQADLQKYRGSQPDPEPANITFDDVRFGRAPTTKRQRQQMIDRANAKSQMLAGKI